MIKAVLKKAIELGAAYERPIAIASGLWFAISCASYIPFMMIPKIPYLTDSNSWMTSGAWNAVWWGFVHPMLEKRREEMRLEAGSKTQSRTEPR